MALILPRLQLCEGRPVAAPVRRCLGAPSRGIAFWVLVLPLLLVGCNEGQPQGRGAERIGPVRSQARVSHGERLALVIGNADYSELKSLRNPGRDAAAVADRLKEIGFTLIGEDGQPGVRPVRDLSETDMVLTLKRFADAAQQRNAEIALIYYAGHGIQIGWRSYLLPVDVPSNDLDLIRRNAVALDAAFGWLDGKAALTVLIFDACREIPGLDRAVATGMRAGALAGDGDRRSAPGNAPGRYRLIAFSAAPNQYAADGSGNHSPYTEMLLEALERPDREVVDFFQSVALEFGRKHGAQNPEVLIQGGSESKFYLRNPTPPPAPPDLVPDPRPPMVGYVQVYTNAPAARVWIGGREVGTVEPEQPLRLKQGLAVGSVEVHITAPGYKATQRRVDITPNAWTQVFFGLEREPPPGLDPGLLARCRAHLQNERYTVPADDNALLCYREVLASDPANVEAKRALATMTAFYTKSAEQALAERTPERVRDRVARLRQIDPESPEAMRIETALAELQPAVAKPKMVRVPAGCFWMGVLGKEDDLYGDDGYSEYRRVCLESFEMSAYEVTNKEYRRFDTAHSTRPYISRDDNGVRHELPLMDGDDQPVTWIDWEDAVAYAQWLSERTGHHYRLPTDKEWEYVARAGGRDLTYWGGAAEDGCLYENFRDRAHDMGVYGVIYDIADHCNDGYVSTAPVGRFSPNAFGVYDILGNVAEFTSSPVVKTLGLSPGYERNYIIARGAHFLSTFDHEISVYRSMTRKSDSRGFYRHAGIPYGIRLVRDHSGAKSPE